MTISKETTAEQECHASLRLSERLLRWVSLLGTIGGFMAASLPVDVAGDEITPEFFSARTSGYIQDGRGFQSQAEPDEEGRGSERAWVIQPIFSLQARQGDDVSHQLSIAVDVVSAASPDALDAISSASRENEAVTLDLRTGIRSGNSVVQFHAMGHAEENYWSTGAGVGVTHSMADDNATLQSSLEFTFDTFDPIQPNGRDLGNVKRTALALNLGFSQLLSPTTEARASYTLTGQAGTLETPWNSLPILRANRIGDRFPQTRMRHAWVAELQQAFPESETYLGLRYRFYADDFDVRAHTAQVTGTQYLGDALWIRGRYRFHTQTAPFFWSPTGPPVIRPFTPRTADSDLEAFDAHEAGLGFRWFYDRTGALTATSSYLELGYTGYFRTNSLTAHAVGFEWGQAL